MPRHFEQRFLPFTPAQLFALVADVERYPEFLPWCLGAKIRERQSDNAFTADLVIGYKALREKFTSVVTLDEPDMISVRYVAGPLKHLNNEWRFTEAAGGCDIAFYVDFGFRSSLLGSMMDLFFDKAFRKMVVAFEGRAEELYGHSYVA